MTTWKPETHLAIAADSIESLRACDVYRLLDSTPTIDAMHSMICHIIDARPDLLDECRECGEEIIDERRALGDAASEWFPACRPLLTSQANTNQPRRRANNPAPFANDQEATTPQATGHDIAHDPPTARRPREAGGDRRGTRREHRPRRTRPVSGRAEPHG